VDTDRFTDRLSRAAARRSFRVPETAFVVGFFGSAHPPSRPRKGVDLFIEAMARLSAKIPELLVFVTGQAWALDIATLSAAGVRVFHPGFLPSRQLPAAYRTLDVFVVASSIEGGPMTAFEALACGVPVVSTRVGMVKDWLEDGTHVLSVEVGQADSVVHAVQQVRDDSAGAAARTAAGQALIRARLKWSDVAPGYGRVYREVLEERSRPRLVSKPRRWYERQRRAALREDTARLMEQEIVGKHYLRAGEILIRDGEGLTGRLGAAGRVVRRRCARRLLHIARSVRKFARLAAL
jgi:glycosyltransferase involved in cell wall biosynthesis